MIEEPPYLPTCSSKSLNDFRENFANRGVKFNLSNAGQYIYDVSSCSRALKKSLQAVAALRCPPAAGWRPLMPTLLALPCRPLPAASDPFHHSRHCAGRAVPRGIPRLPLLDAGLVLLRLLGPLLQVLPPPRAAGSRRRGRDPAVHCQRWNGERMKR